MKILALNTRVEILIMMSQATEHLSNGSSVTDSLLECSDFLLNNSTDVLIKPFF